jgi:hypothetical protein
MGLAFRREAEGWEGVEWNEQVLSSRARIVVSNCLTFPLLPHFSFLLLLSTSFNRAMYWSLLPPTSPKPSPTLSAVASKNEFTLASHQQTTAS